MNSATQTSQKNDLQAFAVVYDVDGKRTVEALAVGEHDAYREALRLAQSTLRGFTGGDDEDVDLRSFPQVRARLASAYEVHVSVVRFVPAVA